MKDPDWQVYIIKASDNSLYTGITTDISRRWNQHIEGKGAKFFRARKPSQLIYFEPGHDRSTASQREAAIKQLSREKKLELISSDSNKLDTLDWQPE